MAPGETVWVTGVLVKEKSQPPPTVKRSGAVEPSTGSVTLTNRGPAHGICEVGTVAVKVIAFTKVVVSAVPLKLITDCAVKLSPVAVSRNAGSPAFAETGESDVRVIDFDAVGSLIFHIPRPWVAATSVREARFNRNARTCEFGRPACNTVQVVAEPAV